MVNYFSLELGYLILAWKRGVNYFSLELGYLYTCLEESDKLLQPRSAISLYLPGREW